MWLELNQLGGRETLVDRLRTSGAKLNGESGSSRGNCEGHRWYTNPLLEPFTRERQLIILGITVAPEYDRFIS